MSKMAEQVAREFKLTTMVPEDDFHWEEEPQPESVKALDEMASRVFERTCDLINQRTEENITFPTLSEVLNDGDNESDGD